jgi:protein SCO1/2
MALLQRKFRGQAGLQLLSVTVDPLHDTPAVLARYARQYGADFANWSFLSGPSARIDGLMQQGFKLQVEHLSVDERGDQLVDIPHTSTVALVDRHGLIRAYYEGVEEASWPKLAQGVAALLAEP